MSHKSEERTESTDKGHTNVRYIQEKAKRTLRESSEGSARVGRVFINLKERLEKA